MDWTTGIAQALRYIEENLDGEIDYEEAARRSLSSSYHFQRVFSILCGYTLGEYIRCRRLSRAGAELAAGQEKVIDIAAKYGYESPDSFARAFQKFHGITPSQARGGGTLRSFSPLTVKFSLEGGHIMNYRIETRKKTVLTGFKTHFTGSPSDRGRQDHNFACATRLKQYVLQGMAHDCDTVYEVITNLGEDGYDFYIAALLEHITDAEFEEDLGQEVADWYEEIPISEGTYLVCETGRCEYPVEELEPLRREAVSQWLPASGYELRDAPELDIIHWFFENGNDALNRSRYCELWLPIVKK